MKPLFGPSVVAIVSAMPGFDGGNALAQRRPPLPIRILAPFATGRASDVSACLLSHRYSERMGSRSWTKTARARATARHGNPLRGAR